MATTVDDIRKLRELTGAGMMDCRSALTEAGGDVDKAVTILREKGIAKAAKRAGRETTNGVVEAYLHRTGDYPPQVGALVELDCETDFVAKSDDFRALARALALHVAGSSPMWVKRDDVPADVLAERQATYRRIAEEEGRPAAVVEQIIGGQIEKFYRQTVLLEQPYVRTPDVTVGELVAE